MEISPNPLFSNPLNFFLNGEAFIEVDGILVHGRFLGYQLPGKEKPHKLFVLITESPLGKIIVRRNWEAIATNFKRVE